MVAGLSARRLDPLGAGCILVFVFCEQHICGALTLIQNFLPGGPLALKDPTQP